MRHPIGRGGDATVIATLPNPPAEIIDAYSRKLSSESMKTAQAPVSPLVFVCVPAARRHTCKTLKGSLSFWRNAQRARSELLGIWFVRLVSRLSTLSHAGWFKLGAPARPSAEREKSTQTG